VSRRVATEREIAGRLSVVCQPQLVGRGPELAALGAVLASPPAVALIQGEAGIGKSRLLQEFLASPAGKRHRALVAPCPPFRQPHTLGPVADALRQAIDDVAGLRLSALAGALRPLFPEWGAVLPAAPEPAEDASAARHRVFRALAELLGLLQVGQLAVEDGQWADEATLEFLLYLASGQPQQVSLVVTYRPEDVPAGSLLPRLARHAAGASGLRLALGPLDVTGTAGLMSSMLAGQHVSAEFAAFVHERTDGVPLAVEESVRLMGERDDLTRRGGAWVRRHLADIDVPPTVRDAVLERAGRFGPAAQAVLRAAAILAEPASDATLAAVSGLPPGRARAGLAVALGCGLLAEDRRGLLSFRHMLAARAVAEAVPVRERLAMHLRAGQALEGATAPPLARLARHFREAGDTGKWCGYAEQAADSALASGDEATAAALLHDLVVSAGLPAGEVARLIRKTPFGSFTWDAQDLVRALRSALDAGRLAPGEEADLRFQLGRVLMVLDEFDAGRAELERAIPHLAHDPVASARAMIILGWPRGTTWTVSAHRRWLRRAGEVTAPSIAAADRMRLSVDRATGLLLLGEEAGWAEAAQIPGDAPTPQERHEITRGYVNTGEMAMMWGRYADASRRLERAFDLAERHQYPRYRDGILANKAHLDWFTGAWDGLAEKVAALAGDEDTRTVSRLETVLLTGLLHAAMGAGAQADECLQLVLDGTLRRGVVDGSMEPAAGLARLRLADGRVEEALKVTDQPIGIVAGKGIWVWATDVAPARVSALTLAGRTEDAAELVAAFARGLRGRDAPAPKAALVLCRAILAEARGESGRAAPLFARAAAGWQALPRPYDALLTRERQARCLLRGGRPQAGVALLHQVFQGLSGLGARGDALRVMHTLRAYGAEVKRPWSGRPGYGDQLSPRELDVARLLVAGRTNRDIAQELFLSPKTVARHVESAMRKLAVASRTALAVRMVETGIVSGDRDRD